MAWWARKERGRYMIGWREPDGTRRYKTFGLMEDARRFKSETESRLDRGEYASKEQRAMLLGTYIDNVLAGGDLGASTLGVYGYRRKHTAKLETKAIGDVTTADIRALMAAMETAGTGAPTRASVRKLLSKVFSTAVREGILVRSPVTNVPTPRSERRQIHVYAPGEIQAISLAIEPRYRSAVYLSAYGGLRGGEVGGLKVAALDLLRGRVSVQEAVSLVRGRATLGAPKTPASRRTVTIPGFVCDELAAHLAAHPPAADGRVFHRNEALVSSKDLGGAFRAAVKDIGLEGRWHDLRHTSVALAIQQGAHPKQIQMRLGHSTITTTLDTYGHLFPSMDEDLAQKMDAVYRDQTEGKVIEL